MTTTTRNETLVSGAPGNAVDPAQPGPATPGSASPPATPGGERGSESGVVGGVTVLVLSIPLLLLSALAVFNGRLSQTDHDLSWAAVSAARAGANCEQASGGRFVPGQALAEPGGAGTGTGATGGTRTAGSSGQRACTLREVGLVVESTVRSLLLENRRLYCLNSSSTGMVLEYLSYGGELIYAYGVGAVLLSQVYWPDRGDDDDLADNLGELFGEDGNPPDPEVLEENPFFPLQSGARRDIQGNRLLLSPLAGNSGSGFETSMLTPLGSTQPVGQIRVNLLCDYTQGSSVALAQCAGLSRSPSRRCEEADGVNQYLSRASSREASAAAVVPLRQ